MAESTPDQLAHELLALIQTEVLEQAAAIVDLPPEEVASRVFNRLRDIQDDYEAGLANGYAPFEGTMPEAIAAYETRASEMDAGLRDHPQYTFLSELVTKWSGQDVAALMDSAGTGTTTFLDIGAEQSHLDVIGEMAQERSVVGESADYIPGLGKVIENGTADKVAIVAVDPTGKKLEFGDALEVRFSAQSTIKPLLFLYALFQGLQPDQIAEHEPTARPFNDDPIFDLARASNKAGHPLDNAGGESSAGAIGGDFNAFLHFMRVLTGNPGLGVDEEVYRSEKRASGGNRSIGHQMEKRGRFPNEYETDRAIDNYTRACAINITAEELARAYQVVASGGVKNGKQIIPRDLTVPVLAAMGSFGLYDNHAEMALMEAGATMLTAKSGVAGAVVNVMPNGVVYVTLSPYLDSAGNSTFGMISGVALNRLFAGNPDMLRPSSGNADRRLDEYLQAQAKATITKKRAQPNKDPRMFRIPEDALVEETAVAVQASLALLSDEQRSTLLAGLKKS